MCGVCICRCLCVRHSASMCMPFWLYACMRECVEFSLIAYMVPHETIALVLGFRLHHGFGRYCVWIRRSCRCTKASVHRSRLQFNDDEGVIAHFGHTQIVAIRMTKYTHNQTMLPVRLWLTKQAKKKKKPCALMRFQEVSAVASATVTSTSSVVDAIGRCQKLSSMCLCGLMRKTISHLRVQIDWTHYTQVKENVYR